MTTRNTLSRACPPLTKSEEKEALIIELLSVYVREGLHKLLRFIQTSNMAANFVSLQTKKERLKTITILLQ